MKKILLFLLIPISSYSQLDPQIEKKVDELISKMTIEEKVGQLNLRDAGRFKEPEKANQDEYKKFLSDLKIGNVGAVFNVVGAKNVEKMQKIVIDNSRLKIPMIFGHDVIHGYKTISPIPLAEASSWDLDLIEKSSRVAAIEASAAGLNWTFAPMVDITRDARWGRVMEGSGEDPYLSSEINKRRVLGFQGTNLKENNTILACAKHFAGYGFSIGGRDYNSVEISLPTLNNIVLKPFYELSKAGVRTFMSSFNDLNGVPSTANSYLLKEILRKYWNYSGMVVSDYNSVMELVSHGLAKDNAMASSLSLNAGLDMDMEDQVYLNELKKQLDAGKVKINQIDDAVRRVLRLKLELGLFENPYKYCDIKREEKLISHTDHHQIVLEMAKKSIVLLKNENNLLPLSKNESNIALIGDLADDKDSPLGNWRGEADPKSAVSVLEGLNNLNSKNIDYKIGVRLLEGEIHPHKELKFNTTDRSTFSEAIESAKKAKYVIMVLGEHAYSSGEARSRSTLDLPGLQQELLEKVYEVNKNIILVLMTGRPLTIKWATEKIPAIILVWHLGTQSGNAIAHAIYGEFNPSGKLPISFPRSLGQVPIYYNVNNTGRPTDISPVVFWSHYGDEKNDALYPFGFGLSYTAFSYSDLKINKKNNEEFEVSVNIKNTGVYDGEEVVQLYIHDVYASIVRPKKELKDFKKLIITKGETKNVSFLIDRNDLGFINNEGDFVVEPGDFDIFVGGSSDSGLKGSLKY